MDLNTLKHGQKLIEKADSTSKIISILKNLGSDLEINDTDITEFKKSLYIIKEDLYIKLIELKSEYDKEFVCL